MVIYFDSPPPLDDECVLRYVEVDSCVSGVQPYRLLTWDTGTKYGNGRTRIGVAFYLHSDDISDPTLISCVGLGAGRHADDSDESLVLALIAVCMRPGDTESDYFSDYTPRAMAWAEHWHSEALSILPFEAECARSKQETRLGLEWSADKDGTERLWYRKGYFSKASRKRHVFKDHLAW